MKKHVITPFVFFGMLGCAAFAQVPEFSSTLDNAESAPIPPPIRNITTTPLYHADGDTEKHLGAYSHHCALAFRDGMLYAAWSNSLKDEDSPGQRVYMRFSKDKGKTWSPALNEKPIELFPSLDKWVPVKKATDVNQAGTCNGFVVVDGDLYAVNEVLPSVFMQQAGMGRIVRKINPDTSLGEIFWIEEKAPAAIEGFPQYPDMSNPAYAGIGKKIRARLADKTKDNLLTWDFKGKRNTSTEIEPDGGDMTPDDKHSLCEPTRSYKTADGLAVLWRDLGFKRKERSNRLYVTTSKDGGDTWSKPVPTGIPDACSRPNAGNLPDGTAYLVNNPGGFGFGKNSRRLLVLSLAKDGEKFDRFYLIAKIDEDLRFKGLFKGGFSAAYPDSIVVDDALFVLYSINKEDVELAKIPLKEITKH